jgi:hypothetical protein
MTFTAPRSAHLFEVIAVVALSFAFVSVQAPTAPNDGAALYKAKCAMCDGPDGAGKTPTRPEAERSRSAIPRSPIAARRISRMPT